MTAISSGIRDSFIAAMCILFPNEENLHDGPMVDPFVGFVVLAVVVFLLVSCRIVATFINIKIHKKKENQRLDVLKQLRDAMPLCGDVRLKRREDSFGADYRYETTIFDEAIQMLTHSDAIYFYTSLREHARRKKRQDLVKALRFPQQGYSFAPAVLSNLETLYQDKECYNFEPLDIKEYQLGKQVTKTFAVEDMEIIHIADQSKDIENACVYSISVNRSRKRFTVVFRGCVERSGFKKCADTDLCPEKNPIVELQDSISIYYSYQGIKKTLLGYEQAIFRHIEDYKARHPGTQDYALYACGHSLGGALATLFGFSASLKPEYVQNGPVVVYSFASPPVGDFNFQRAFKHQEDSSKIRHARIFNSKDVVPMLASALGMKLRHAGLGIALAPVDEQHSQTATKPGGFGALWEVANQLISSEYVQSHSRLKTFKLLEENKVYLQETMGQAYSNSHFRAKRQLRASTTFFPYDLRKSQSWESIVAAINLNVDKLTPTKVDETPRD